MTAPFEADPIAPFKQAAGRFASGVTVVTTKNENHLYGITCSSFVSLSLNPLLITVSVNSQSPFIEEVRQAQRFAVSVLSSEQQHVSQYFATRDRGHDVEAFPGIPTEAVTTGAPVVSESLSWFDARLHAILAGGDHQILVGEVVSAGGREGEPLLYWAGEYRQLDVADGTDPLDSDDAANSAAQAAEASERLHHFADAISVQLHVNGLSKDELLEAERALEPAAAALAAVRQLPAGLRALEQALTKAQEAAADPSRFTAASLAFHQALGPASGNPALAASMEALGRSQHAHYAAGTTPETIRRTLAAHEEIFAAIKSGDPDQARESMWRHLVHVGSRMAR